MAKMCKICYFFGIMDTALVIFDQHGLNLYISSIRDRVLNTGQNWCIAGQIR